jgi:hypothetical protein
VESLYVGERRLSTFKLRTRLGSINTRLPQFLSLLEMSTSQIRRYRAFDCSTYPASCEAHQDPAQSSA